MGIGQLIEIQSKAFQRRHRCGCDELGTLRARGLTPWQRVRAMLMPALRTARSSRALQGCAGATWQTDLPDSSAEEPFQ
jgi:hypothetical protein